MLRLNKKGLIEDWFDYIFTIFAMILLFFFLSGIFSSGIDEGNAAVLEEVQASNINQQVLSLLQTKVDYNESTITYEQLIELSQDHSQKQLEESFLKISKDVMNPAYGNNSWAVNICYENKGSHSGKCWLYANLNRWQSAVAGEEGNLESEGEVTFIDQKNERVTVKLRILK